MTGIVGILHAQVIVDLMSDGSPWRNISPLRAQAVVVVTNSGSENPVIYTEIILLQYADPAGSELILHQNLLHRFHPTNSVTEYVSTMPQRMAGARTLASIARERQRVRYKRRVEWMSKLCLPPVHLREK